MAESSSPTPSALTDAVQNPSNPYYIHPIENPSLVLVSPVLIGTNYHSWSRAMKMALQSKISSSLWMEQSPLLLRLTLCSLSRSDVILWW